MASLQLIDNVKHWIDGIPDGWTCVQLKYVVSKMNRPVLADDPIVVCTNKGTVELRGDKSPGLISLTGQGYQGVKPGDLLIHGMDTWHGAIAVSKLSGQCTSVVHVCDSDEDKRFLAYYLRALAYRGVYKAFSNGVRQNTSDFRSWEKAGEIPIVLPSRDEQQCIANYLDAKHEEIDRAIEAAERSIEEYEAYRDVIIFMATTKGIACKHELEDSEIDWVGKIPSSWSLCRWKYLLKERIEKNNPVRFNNILSLSAAQGVVPYSERKGGGNKSKADLSEYKIARKGDIVLNSMNVVSGSVALSEYDGCVSPVYYMYYPATEDVNIRYYSWLFKSSRFQRSLFGLGNGIMYKESGNGKLNTVRMRISSQVLGSLKMPFPPIVEQALISDYLDDKCSEIDSIIASKRAIVADLKAFKQTLIYEVVTGKREV